MSDAGAVTTPSAAFSTTRTLRTHFWAPFALLLIIAGFYWKITLTKQFDWMWGPDLAQQVLPWYDEEARQMRHSEFPLWDPHTWAGQPLLAQGQPGAAYPLNWILFLLPPSHGRISTSALNWYYVLTRYLAALFCYLLCRDLGLSPLASLAGGFVFAAGSFVGTVVWPQMVNGAIWSPLIFLFLLRAVRLYRPLASAALCGMFWGISWLSGHHQAPTFITLAVGGAWLFYILRDRSLRLAGLAAISAAFMFLTGALQLLPAFEYGRLATRWVGTAEPVGWHDAVPYTVQQQMSLSPLHAIGIVISGIQGYTSAFIGVVALTLAIIAIAMAWNRPAVRLFAVLAAASFAYALGVHNVFQGMIYALVPFVEKARTPAMAIAVFGIATAVLAAFGVDQFPALRASAWGRRIAWGLLGFGLAVWIALYSILLAKGLAWAPFDNVSMTALLAVIAAILLFAWRSGNIGPRAGGVLLIGLLMIELGTVTDAAFASRSDPGRMTWLKAIRSNPEIAGYLRGQSGHFRVELEVEELGLNWPEYYNLDQIKSYLASLTTNWTVPEFYTPQTRSLFGVRYTVGRTTVMPDAKAVADGAAGIKVFENPHAFPRAWAVHAIEPIATPDQGDILIAKHLDDLHAKAFIERSAGVMPPALTPCDAADSVDITRYRAEYVAIHADMACNGMVVLSDTFYPGWKATVDGRPAHIYPVDFTMRGVVVAAGKHEVQYRFRPASVYAGAALTAAGILGACFLAFLSRKRPDPIDLDGESRNNHN